VLSLLVAAAAVVIFFARLPADAPAWAARPAPIALICLFFDGVAMALIILAPRMSLLIGVLALGGATPALFRVITLSLYGDGLAVDNTRFVDSMAIPEAALEVWFVIACVLMHPRLDFGRAVFAPGLRGRVLRRALPAMILAPAILAAAASVAARAFGWPIGMLFGATATLTVALGVGLIWWITSMVQQWQVEANEHAGRLSRANEALEQYASAAAHDLKAPARHILLYSELLEDAQKRGDQDSVHRFASSIREAAAELPVVIDGMLEYSRSAWTRLNLGQHKLSELVGAAAELQAGAIRAERGQVAVVRDAQILCDPILMTAVFQNLIANSLKSGKAATPVHIKVDAAREGDAWKIVFEDNGKGFTREEAPVVFNPLVRGVQLKGEGTGIGLATCRTIVESHRGTIRVDPDFRDGARIVFTLAANPPPQAVAVKALPGANSKRG